MVDFISIFQDALNVFFENIFVRNVLFVSVGLSLFFTVFRCVLDLVDCDPLDFLNSLFFELKYFILFKKFLKYKFDDIGYHIIKNELYNLGFHCLPKFENLYDLLYFSSQSDLKEFSSKLSIDSKKLCKSYNKFLKRFYRHILFSEPVCFDDIYIPSDELFTSASADVLRVVLRSVGKDFYIKHNLSKLNFNGD